MDHANTVQDKTSSQATLIQNPYASKKRCIPSQQEYVSTKASTLQSSSIQSCNTNPVGNDSKSTVSEKIGDHDKATTPSSSSDTLYWQRLPSQNLSFGSAEILTVDECITHASLYKGRSIRTTGILRNRFFQGDNIVLELTDPAPKRTQIDSGHKTLKGHLQPRASIATKAIHKPISIEATPSSKMTLAKKPVAGARRSLLGSSLKRPLPGIKLGAKQTANGRPVGTPLGQPMHVRTTLTTNKNSINQGMIRKRKRTSFASSGAKKIAPPKTLKIISAPSIPQLEQLTLGTTVMITGVFSEKEMFQARFIHALNNFDATFYSNSLIARRQLVYRNYHNVQKKQECLTSTVTENKDDNVTPIQGCGPPPYTSFLKDGTTNPKT